MFFSTRTRTGVCSSWIEVTASDINNRVKAFTFSQLRISSGRMLFIPLLEFHLQEFWRSFLNSLFRRKCCTLIPPPHSVEEGVNAEGGGGGGELMLWRSSTRNIDVCKRQSHHDEIRWQTLLYYTSYTWFQNVCTPSKTTHWSISVSVNQKQVRPHKEFP